MAQDPKTLRINDADNPNRLDEFERTLKKAGGDANKVIRQLIDAYIKHVAEHDHAPTFPVKLSPVGRQRRK